MSKYCSVYLVRVEVCQGVVFTLVLCLVVHHVVAVREGSSLNILSRQSHMDSVFHE